MPGADIAKKALKQRQVGANQLLSATQDLSQKSLMERFHVDLAHGTIWLDNRRVLVLQAEWFADLRAELINRLGNESARGILTRLGYAAGIRDAQLAIKLNPGFGLLDLISSGQHFHAFQGSVAVEPLVVELDISAKHCYLEFLWKNSIEDDIHSKANGRGVACWMETGYASGFLTTCIGADTIVREVECAALGHSACRCVARFTHEWEDIAEDLKYLDLSVQPVPLEATAQTRGTTAIQKADATQVIDAIAFPQGMGLIGRSTAFNTTLHQVHRVARSVASVLLLGESGVGKSAIARYVHQCSDRKDKPFVEVNCAAIPESLLEAELFGVERGAFTGAANTRTGRFSEADSGTLFLDEVGLLSGSAQGKLLRVLQSQRFERLGSTKTQQVDVRLVAATNENLEFAVREGRFRSDLFYRLNVFPITVPPLRNRIGDLPLLIDHLISVFCQRHGRPLVGITPRAYPALLHHSWPGNIRELENVIERAVILIEPGEAIDLHHLFTNDADFERTGLLWLDEGGNLVDVAGTNAALGSSGEAPSTDWVKQALAQPGQTLHDIDQAIVLAALKDSGGHIGKAADRLGITRAQIDYRLKKWGIDSHTYR